MDHPHPPTTAPACGLDDDGITDIAGNAQDLIRILGQGALRTRHHRHLGLYHGLFGCDLVPHQADSFGSWPNKDKTTFLYPLGKISTLGQKPVPRMNGLCISDLGGGNNGRHIEVAILDRGWSDTDRLICQTYVFGLSIRLGMHDNGLDTQLSTSTLNA